MNDAKTPVLVALYCRVSTKDQTLEGQQNELEDECERRGWVVCRVYSEKITATGRFDRKQYDRLLADARKIDRPWTHLLVWSLDRFSREETFTKATQAVLDLEAAGVRFVSLKDSIVNTPAEGKPDFARDLLLAALPVIAAFESRRRSERVAVAMKEIREGRRKTRSGLPPGRPAVLSEKIVDSIVALRQQTPPVPYSQIAIQIRVRASTARRAYSMRNRGLPLFKIPDVQKGSFTQSPTPRAQGSPFERQARRTRGLIRHGARVSKSQAKERTPPSGW